MNSKILFLILLSTVFVSCEISREVDSLLMRQFVNQTDKRLYVVTQTNCGTDSIMFGYLDTANMMFVYKQNISLPPIGPYRVDIEMPIIEKEVIYNLSDTTCYDWNKMENFPDFNAIENKELRKIIGNNEVRYRTYITDSLLNLFQKDYSLLDRFSEYYK